MKEDPAPGSYLYGPEGDSHVLDDGTRSGKGRVCRGPCKIQEKFGSNKESRETTNNQGPWSAPPHNTTMGFYGRGDTAGAGKSNGQATWHCGSVLHGHKCTR